MKHVYKVIAAMAIILSIWLLPEPQTIEVEEVTFKSFEVTISGAVLMPKTIRLYQPITWDTLLEYVGGYYQADENYKPIYYEFDRSMTIEVPFKKEVTNEAEITKVNINKADFQTLIQIPFMTETRAAELIIYRQIHGPFTSIEELIHVKYIGTQTLENLRPYISIS